MNRRTGSDHAPSPPAAAAAEGDACFADLLRAAIAARGLALDRLQARLAARGHDVSTATISYWQTGRSVPTRGTSLEALAALEEILGLPQGRLTAAARAARMRLDQGTTQETIASETDVGATVGRLAGQLGMSMRDGLERLMLHVAVHVDAQRRQYSQVTRVHARATYAGIERLPVGVRYDNPQVPARFEVREGGEFGRILHEPDLQLYLAEFLLPHPLRMGEPVLITTALTEVEPPPPVTYLEVGFMAPLRIIHLEVFFTEPTLPARVWGYHQGDDGTTRTPLPAPLGHATHLITDAPAGVHGIAWTW